MKDAIFSTVFWKAGEYGGIKVSEPMIVMTRENGNNIEITLSDPTHKLEKATVQIAEKIENAQSDSRIKVSSGTSTVLNIDFKNSDGASLSSSGVCPD